MEGGLRRTRACCDSSRLPQRLEDEVGDARARRRPGSRLVQPAPQPAVHGPDDPLARPLGQRRVGPQVHLPERIRSLQGQNHAALGLRHEPDEVGDPVGLRPVGRDAAVAGEAHAPLVAHLLVGGEGWVFEFFFFF